MDRERVFTVEEAERLHAARQALEQAQERHRLLTRAEKQTELPAVRKSLQGRVAVAAEVLHRSRVQAAVALRALGLGRD